MPEKPTSKKLSDKSTKQEMIDAYQTLLKEVEEKKAAGLNPEKRLEERKADEAVKIASALTPDEIDQSIAGLKGNIGRMLADISDKLAAEVARFKSLQKAIETKQKEVEELYGIEKAAGSLAALIEAQNQKRREFEEELTGEKEQLEREIETTRAEWEKEKKGRESESKERETTETKARDREKEDYLYSFNREQQSLRDKLADEKATLEKEIQRKREAAEKDLAEREEAVAGTEQELAQLRNRAASFPAELSQAVEKSIAEANEKLKLEAKNKDDLLRKEFEGARNVAATRIESLEKINKEQADQNGKLAKQLETAYQKVQEIAEKAIDGSSQSKSFTELQKLLSDQLRKPAQESGRRAAD